MINLNQLRVFYHAAKCQNFTKAAEELFISQPAVTAQIKSFEIFCNLTLFRKSGRKVYLTSEGHILYDCACKLFENEKEVENAIEGLQKMTLGMLRVGTTKTYARFFMPHLLSNYRKAYPHIKIFLNEGSSQNMTLSLLEFKNDVAVVAKSIDNEEVRFIPFGRDKLILVLSPSHPLASYKQISFDQLAGEPIIMKEEGSGTRKEVDALFKANHCVPNILVETSNAELIKQLVMQGEGLAFLVQAVVAREIAEQKLTTVQLKGYQPSLDVSIAYLKNHPLSPPVQAFLDMLETLRFRDVPPPDVGGLMGKILATKVHKL